MMKMNNKVWLTAAMVTAFLTGCQKSADLETRVTDRWNHLIEGELSQAYEYFSPGYKAGETLDSFRIRTQTAQMHATWNTAQFVSSECEDEQVCEVKVEINYSYRFPQRSMGGMDVTTTIHENWLKVDDTWYFVPKND